MIKLRFFSMPHFDTQDFNLLSPIESPALRRCPALWDLWRYHAPRLSPPRVPSPAPPVMARRKWEQKKIIRLVKPSTGEYTEILMETLINICFRGGVIEGSQFFILKTASKTPKLSLYFFWLHKFFINLFKPKMFLLILF